MHPLNEFQSRTQKIKVRPAFKTLATAFAIGLAMLFSLADVWAKVEDVLDVPHHKAMTPAENAYWHREHEARVLDAMWKGSTSGTKPPGLRGSAQQIDKTQNQESQLLSQSCKTYLRLKDAKVGSSTLDASDSAEVGFCRGFFGGFASAASGSLTEPDENGHVKELKFTADATIDQLIRVFVIAVDVKPELLKQDAGAIIVDVVMSSGLATFESRPGVYVKQPSQ